MRVFGVNSLTNMLAKLVANKPANTVGGVEVKIPETIDRKDRFDPSKDARDLFLKYSKARRIKTLHEIDGDLPIKDKGARLAGATKYLIRTSEEGRSYVYFDDGSLRTVTVVDDNTVRVGRTKGKAAVKAAKRTRMRKAGLLPTKTALRKLDRSAREGMRLPASYYNAEGVGF